MRFFKRLMFILISVLMVALQMAWLPIGIIVGVIVYVCGGDDAIAYPVLPIIALESIAAWASE